MKTFCKKIVLLILGVVMVGCAGSNNARNATPQEYPKSPEQKREERTGSFMGNGVVLFNNSGSGVVQRNKAAPSGMAGSVVWQAALDSLSFIPIASMDSNSGVIITEWYEAPEARGERFKLNILVVSPNLQANAVKVRVFKQTFSKDGWRDASVNPSLAHDFEDQILTNARKITHINSGL